MSGFRPQAWRLVGSAGVPPVAQPLNPQRSTLHHFGAEFLTKSVKSARKPLSCPTLNPQPPVPAFVHLIPPFSVRLRHSMFDVRCSMFPIPSLSTAFRRLESSQGSVHKLKNGPFGTWSLVILWCLELGRLELLKRGGVSDQIRLNLPFTPLAIPTSTRAGQPVFAQIDSK
ncbi:MAG: hypothetical protein JWQ04_3499 [Pedosphaera sp.]|nr:hypothetical protein [Pedosphaera sp.]